MGGWPPEVMAQIEGISDFLDNLMPAIEAKTEPHF